MARISNISPAEQLAKIRREGEERQAQRVAQQFGIPYFDVKTMPVQTDALALVPEEKARKLNVAPFYLQKDTVSLAVLNPESSKTKSLISELQNQGYLVKLFAASESALKQVWEKYKFVVKKGEEITGRVAIEQDRFEKLSRKLNSIEKTRKEIENFDYDKFTTGQLLEVILAGAMKNRASDIHFEAEPNGARLRYRIDGLLYDVVPSISADVYKFIVSRVKLLSGLKLNIHDEAQDGRFSIYLNDREIEMRVSLIPSEFGETIVMRILDPQSIRLELEDLGFRDDDLEIIKSELKKPNGMILNTGPTGSGKTTTLYAFLLIKRNPEIKIITLEDPIEYHLEDIEQTQVNPDVGYTFASGLRSILRQDPDVLLIGEIRDQETGQIAMQAALTGHLVFSTVHANSSAGAIPRLLDLKINPASIGPALNLVIAQRLVRRLCEKCKVKENVSDELKKKIEKFLEKIPRRVKKDEYKNPQIYKAKGCAKCGGLGYKGRIGIFELMIVGDEMESLITPGVREIDIFHQARKQGMVTMQEDGILKTLKGITTFEEVERVTGSLQM